MDTLSPTAPTAARPPSSAIETPGHTAVDRDADAMALGATMYVPAIHPAIQAIVAGERLPTLRSVVLCLEDALHPDDTELGLARLRTLLEREPDERDRVAAGPRVFVRPRDRAMATRILRFPGIARVEGFVVPKIAPGDVEPWWRLVAGTSLRLMPTLESAWVFDPRALGEFVEVLGKQDRSTLVALRIGGNDLLSSMRLRRARGTTLYDGPLAWGLSQLMCQLGSRGFPLTAPVFDVLDDPETLAVEARRDAGFGFVGKTAVHPDQIGIIEAGFAVTAEDLAIASETLAPDAEAVFRRSGRMLEPAVHGAWARRTLARAAAYGAMA